MPVATPRGQATPRDAQAQRIFSLLQKDAISNGPPNARSAPASSDPSRRPLPSPVNGPPQQRLYGAPQAPRGRDVLPSPRPLATPKQAPSRPQQKRPSGFPPSEDAPRSDRPYSPRDGPPNNAASQSSRGPSRLASGGDGNAREPPRRRSAESFDEGIPVARTLQDRVCAPRSGAEYCNVPQAARVPSPRVPILAEQDCGHGYGQQYSSQQQRQYASSGYSGSQQPAHHHNGSGGYSTAEGYSHAPDGRYLNSDNGANGDWRTGLPERARTVPTRGHPEDHSAGGGAGSSGW